MPLLAFWKVIKHCVPKGLGDSFSAARRNHKVSSAGLAVLLKNENFYSFLKNWTLLASSIIGICVATWRALGFLPRCLGFVALSSCQYLESSLLGLGTKGFCLNLKIFKIQKWQPQVMTGYTIAVESQQEIWRAYTRAFAFLFLSLCMGGWQLWCEGVQECLSSYIQ